jgi:hypothetical protein
MYRCSDSLIWESAQFIGQATLVKVLPIMGIHIAYKVMKGMLHKRVPYHFHAARIIVTRGVRYFNQAENKTVGSSSGKIKRLEGDVT